MTKIVTPWILEQSMYIIIKDEKWFQFNQHPGFYSSKRSEVSRLFLAEYLTTLRINVAGQRELMQF